MSRSRRGGAVAAAVALLATSAGAAVASTAITPKNGTYKGHAHYTVAGKAHTASLTVTVAKHKVSRVQMMAQYPLPIDQQTSQNASFCAAQSWDTKGEKRTVTLGADGAFKYTFKSASSTATSKSSDKLTLVGKFTSATKAVGIVRDVNTFSSSSLNLKCDTGKMHFSVKRS